MRHLADEATPAYMQSFNLRREAAPHATKLMAACPSDMLGFNLRREAAPHATPQRSLYATESVVSISDEKPLHMRLDPIHDRAVRGSRFNLRREAAPHATPQPGCTRP